MSASRISKVGRRATIPLRLRMPIYGGMNVEVSGCNPSERIDIRGRSQPAVDRSGNEPSTCWCCAPQTRQSAIGQSGSTILTFSLKFCRK